jgi:hypothetical protein
MENAMPTAKQHPSQLDDADPAKGGIEPARDKPYPSGDSPKPHGDKLQDAVEDAAKKKS